MSSIFVLKWVLLLVPMNVLNAKKPMKLVSNDHHDGFSWWCRHKNAVRRSVRKGTWFQESRLTLVTMLKLAYLWIKRTKYAWITHELKTTQNTVCDWMAFFRKVCVNAVEKEKIFLGGPNEIVEIDAKSFSNIKNKHGRETWVFGGVQRSNKNCFLEIIQTGEENEIISILQKYVQPGTIIMSDNWKGYDCLESNGYMHLKVMKISELKTVSGAVVAVHKNNILSLWGRLKKIVSNRIVQFDAYLAEVMWRRLHKDSTQELLMSYFKIISQIFPPQVRDDPTYMLRRIEKDEKVDFVKIQSKEINSEGGLNNHEREIHSKEINAEGGFNNNERETCLIDANDNNNKVKDEIHSKEINAEGGFNNNEREIQSKEINTEGGLNNHESEIQSKEINTEGGLNNHESETRLIDANDNNNKVKDESVWDLQNFDNQYFEEIELPLVFSEDSSSEDDSIGENENQNKRLKTMEKSDT